MFNESTIKLLVINLGSTSTKIAVYENEQEIHRITLNHVAEDLQQFSNVWEQYSFRRQLIADWIQEQGYRWEDFKAIVSRGGIMQAITSGVYRVNWQMMVDIKNGQSGQHACNIGCQICYDLSCDLGILPITVDPPATNETLRIAAYSGIPEIWRSARFHLLNQKATARKLAAELNKDYENLKIVVVHLGGGISIAAHHKGKVFDVNNALDGDGPFSPERSGGLPAGDLIRLCFSGRFSEAELLKRVNGQGGLMAYLGSTDGLEIEKRIKEGDDRAEEVIEAMAFQIAKEIGAAATTLRGDVEAILLTGGLANWSRLVSLIKERVSFLAPIYVRPGENELEALALGALRCLRGKEPLREYPGVTTV